VFVRVPVLTEEQVVLLFMRGSNEIWEAIKELVILIERNDKEGSLKHTRAVWIRQISQYSRFEHFKELLNKCLVLTSFPKWLRLEEHVKTEGNDEGESAIPSHSLP